MLAIQDTTEIDYTAHPEKKGLGQIGNESGRGLLMHTTLAITVSGLPLGILEQQIWARKIKKNRKPDPNNTEHKKLSIKAHRSRELK